MMPTTTKQLVEAQCGRSITDAEYEAALRYALMKLNAQSRILHREFDARYLAIVTAELVMEQRMDAVNREIIGCIQLFRKVINSPDMESGLRDGNLGDREEESDAGTSSLCPYYNTVPDTTQYMGV